MLLNNVRRRAEMGVCCGCALLLGGMPVSAQVSAQVPPGVYEDHRSDAALKPDGLTRIRLTGNDDIELGRAGGVWGALGEGDPGDSFFVGKTPELTNLQVTLRSPAGSPPVRCVVTGTDGRDIKTYEMTSAPGKNTTRWIALKGSIDVDVLPVDDGAGTDSLTHYALYIWYPGGSVDSLNAAEIAEITSGDYAQRPVLFSARKQGD